MNKFKKISVILIAIVTIVGTFAINSFAIPGHSSPVSKIIPSATAIVEKTGGITQTPTAIAKNPYAYDELYTGGNVDNSVRINVYSTDTYLADDGVPGTKSLHFVFTSRNAFKFYIDFGAISDTLTYSGNFIPTGSSDVASYFRFSYKVGGAQSINSLSRPYNLFSVDSSLSNIQLGGVTLEAEPRTVDNFDTDVYLYHDFSYGGENIAGINYISGVVDGDVGNYYNFIDIQICIQDFSNSKGYFNGVDTNCDMLTDAFLAGIHQTSYAVGEEMGYDYGFDRGLAEGYQSGFDDGRDEGFQQGYNDGYDIGYNDGFEAVGAFDFIINGVEGFLSAELFPGFSFGILLMAVAGLGMFIWILKIFAGG